jgi:ribonuclease HI
MAKQKFYVVWKGRQTGVFETWDDCKAVYKSFKTRQLAEQAFKDEWWEYIGKDIFETELTEEQLLLVGKPIEESISVDGAWNTSTGVVEYRGVYTKTKEPILKVGPLEDGTNNIVEFLGIVHALAHCKKNNITLPIYSDSRNAIRWVRDKEARTNHIRSDKNKKLFELLDRAVKWLKENE